MIDKSRIRNKNVYITGGTGFIGSRLAEKLIIDYGANVTILAQRFTNASRVARLPVRLCKVNLLDKTSLSNSIGNCDYIVHCAFGSRGTPQEQYDTNVLGTQNLARIAIEKGVQRFVHFSTVMVYGTPREGEITENSPYEHGINTYADEKIKSEEIVRQLHKESGLPYVILQPSAVIGPYAVAWTYNILERLKKKKMILVNDGNGICNFIYIDDCVNGIINAMISDEAIGETFLLSSEETVLWREFFSQYESILGFKSTVSLSEREAMSMFNNEHNNAGIVSRGLNAILNDPRIKRRVRRILEKRTIYSAASILVKKRILREYVYPPQDQNGKRKKFHVIDPHQIAFYASTAKVNCEKARAVLDLKNKFSFRDSMNIIGSWAKWSHIVQ
jgi:nucleoside-diphosphate-sugar epimerase